MHNIYIIGSGAMGCLWGSYFDDSTALHFIQRSGPAKSFTYTVLPSHQKIHATHTSPIALSNSVATTKIKYLIIATKAFDALNAVKSVQNQFADDCQILLIQNGMGSQQDVAKQFKHLAVYACSSTEGAYKQDSHTLMHAGKGDNNIGPLTPLATSLKLQSWLPAEKFTWHDKINPILWQKLIINCAINPLTVIYQCRNGELITNTKALSDMTDVCAELDLVCKKLSFDFAPCIDIAKSVCQSTSNNYSSMYQDNKNGKQTEIDFITGFFIQQCREHGIQAKHNMALLDKIRDMSANK